jgi:hypothetical protein
MKSCDPYMQRKQQVENVGYVLYSLHDCESPY